MTCKLVGHLNGGAVVENGGHSFSRCLRCRRDLVEKSGRWRAAPKGYRIVWRPASPPQAAPAEAGDRLSARFGEGAERRRGNDRRRFGQQRPFEGPERRGGPRERRAAAANGVILQRDGLRISRDAIVVGGVSYRPFDVDDVDLSTHAGPPDLVWLLYGSLAALAAFNAWSASEPALWAISGALLVFAHISWRRRRPQPRSRVVLTVLGERTTILETGSAADAGLVKDAISMALPAAA